MTVTPSVVSSRVRARLLTIAVVCTVPVILMLAGQFLDSRENVVTRCLLATAPAGAVRNENPIVSASVTAFPAGRRCVYDAIGGGTISTQTGWPLSLFAAISTVAVAVMTILILRRSRQHVFVALLPGLLVTLLWGAAILNSRTILG